MKQFVRSWFVRGLTVAVALLAGGCLSPVHTRPARVLEPGENEAAMGLSQATAMASAVDYFDGSNVAIRKPAATEVLVNAAPELSYHRGIVKDVEIGVRVGGAALLGQLEGQYRYLRTPTAAGELHLSAGLQAGTQLAKSVAGSRLVLPLRATLDLTPNLGLSAAVHAGWRWVDAAAVDPQLPPDKIDALRWIQGNGGLEYGAGLLADYRTDSWFARLGVEIAQWSGHIGAQGRLSDYSTTTVQAVLAGGLTWGKDAAQIRKAAEDLDSLTAPKVP